MKTEITGEGGKSPNRDMLMSYRERNPGNYDILKKLGNPHLAFKVLHVAGTNGKGSTCAMLDSILRQNPRLKVGLFTSPHIHSVRERIVVNGKPISRSDFVRQMERLEPMVDVIGPGSHPFQKLTLMAFSYFRDVGVDWGVIEVGIGGLKDCTNVFSAPQLKASAITSIGLDHTNVLGKTFGSIAKQKAGIIKPGVPSYTISQIKTAQRRISSIARKVGSPHVILKEPPADVVMELKKRNHIPWKTFQKNNVALASQITQDLVSSGELSLPVGRSPASHIAEGLENTFWPARLEELPRRPGDKTARTIIDCAHNHAAVGWLRRGIKEKTPNRSKTMMIFGASRSKDIDSYVNLVPEIASRVIVTRSNHPRAIHVPDLKSKVEKSLKTSKYNVEVFAAESPREAILLSQKIANEGDTIYGFGSVFVAAGLRQAWNELYPGSFSPNDWVQEAANEPVIGIK